MIPSSNSPIAFVPPSRCAAAFRPRINSRVTSNIFRCDDYVGTFVRGASQWTAQNVPLGVGGHVDYWRPEVFAWLVKEGRVLRPSADAAVT